LQAKNSQYQKNNLNIPLIWALYFTCATALTFENFFLLAAEPQTAKGLNARAMCILFLRNMCFLFGSGAADVKRAQCQRNTFFSEKYIYIYIWQRSRGQKKGSMPDAWHAQPIVGVDLKRREIIMANPIKTLSELDLEATVASPATLRIRGNEVLCVHERERERQRER
jgi:hypothetical protein